MTDDSQQAALIAVDWGTSNFRAYLLDRDGEVMAERAAEQGILKVSDGGFPAAFRAQLGSWLAPGLSVLMAGMIGSRQGWSEAPYVACPAGLEDLASALHVVPGDLGRKVMIVPGLSWRDKSGVHDVIRGEETQLVGLDPAPERRVVCLPGTHAKWAIVEGERIVSFSTAMSGEVFALLCQHSILGRLMVEQDCQDDEAFARGVARAKDDGGLLHHLFGVRAQGLFEAEPVTGLRSYLSGLLIGHEIAGIETVIGDVGHVTLVGAAGVRDAYAKALELSGCGVTIFDGGSAVTVGLWRIAQRAGLLGVKF